MAAVHIIMEIGEYGYKTDLRNKKTGNGALMEKREEPLRLWLDMWLKKCDFGISDIFSENVVYTESWGPEYHGSLKIQLRFDEWNRRGTVLQRDIRQYFHKENKTIIKYYFKNTMDNRIFEAFDGISFIKWAQDGRIQSLKEFGCNTSNYGPYRNGDVPPFKDNPSMWF